MVTYTILHEFTTCDPCHVQQQANNDYFWYLLFSEREQKSEHYLFWINTFIW